MKKEFPILEFDPDCPAKLEPGHLIKAIDIPEHCVVTFFNNELHKLHQGGQAVVIKKLKTEIGTHLVLRIQLNGKPVALFHPGVGAPLAAGLLEEVIALGCRKFIVCGSAGVLRSELEVGKLVIPTSAVRDEGTSYHYLSPAREVHQDRDAVNAITETLNARKLDFELVKTWTTDAFYRETAAKIALRRAEGCSTVEMEAAALFAVAQFRNVKLGQILYAGDDVAAAEWQSRGWPKQKALRKELIWIAAEACLALA